MLRTRWLRVSLYAALLIGLTMTLLIIMTKGIVSWWYEFGNLSIVMVAFGAKLLYDFGGFGNRLRLPAIVVCLIGMGVMFILLIHLGSWWLAVGQTADLNRRVSQVLGESLGILCSGLKRLVLPQVSCS